MSNFFSGGGGSGGGYGIGASQPSSSSAFTNPVNPGFGGFDTGGTQFADPSSAFGGGANGGANLWGDKQQQQQDIIIDQPGSGVGAGTPLFPYAPSAATTTHASTWASSNGIRGGSTNIGDDYVVPSGNLFQFAPRTSIVVLGTFFGIAVVVLTRIAKNVRMGIAFATTLTLAASIGFMFEWGDMEVSCQDVWEKNLGIGVLFGFLLALTIWLLKRTILRLSKAERDRQTFLDSGLPLQGTVVQKSIKTVKVEDNTTRYYKLHIRYNDEIRGMSSLTKTGCSPTSIYQETELESKASKTDTISTIASSLGMESPSSNVQPRVQWYWKETISAMGEEQELETDDPLCWVTYDDDCNLQLETAFQEGMTYSPEIMGRYIVEFPTMTQTNVVTGFQRMVKRIILSADEDDLCHQKETHKPDINPLQKNQFDDEFPDSHFGTPIYSPGDTSNVSGYKISTDVERQYQEEKATVTTIYPFEVKKQVYDEFEIGDYIELLQLPRNPFAIQVKSELTEDYSYLCMTCFFIPLMAYPVPLGLGIYLPMRFQNWDFCRESVIVCMSSMVITCVFLLFSCGCLHTSMTLSQFLKKIQRCRARNNEITDDVEVKESHDAALASLQEKVVRAMSIVPDGDDAFRLSCDEVEELLYRTLFQADVSAGRTIPNCVVDRGGSIQSFADELSPESLQGCIEMSTNTTVGIQAMDDGQTLGTATGSASTNDSWLRTAAIRLRWI